MRVRRLKIRRLLLVVLIGAMLLSGVTGGVAAAAPSVAPAPDYGWYTADPDATEFSIGTAAELLGFSHITNEYSGLEGVATGTEAFNGKTVKLTANIDISCYGAGYTNDHGYTGWPTIGDTRGISHFRGTFDGTGHTISGLYIKDDVSGDEFWRNHGLFSYVNGTVQNLNLDGVYIDVTANSAAGGIAAHVTGGGLITNCSVKGTLMAERYVGGIAGYVGRSGAAQDAVVENCQADVAVRGYLAVGGIAGFCSGGGRVSSCTAAGTTNYFDGGGHGGSTGAGWAGGIVGIVDSGGNTIENCSSSVNLTGSPANILESSQNVGGIAGSVTGDVAGATISNCVSTGNVTGTGLVGGIAAMIEGEHGHVDYSPGTAIMINCYSTGKVTGIGEGDDGYTSVGGIVGEVDARAKVTNCYTISEVVYTGPEASLNIGGVAGLVKENGALSDCAALNPAVSAGEDSIWNKRVAIADSESTLNGNIAFSDMILTRNSGETFKVTDGAANNNNGLDVSAEQLQTAAGFPTGFTASPWTYAQGSLPGLNGATVPMPEHLKVATPPPAAYAITVETDGNGTAAAGAATATAGATVTLTNTPNAGYVFDKWQALTPGVIITDNSFTMPASAVTVRATFVPIPVPTYDVTVVGGTVRKEAYAEGETVVASAEQAPDGQRFKDWTIVPDVTFSDGTDASSQNVGFVMPAQAVTLTANYEPLPAGEYAVTVRTDGNGTAAANAVSALEGAVITLSTTPNAGYVFEAWQSLTDGVTIADNSFTMPDFGVTVRASFKAVYTVNFVLNGGTHTGGGALIQTVAEGGAATAPNVSRSGYTFAGWDAAFSNVTSNLTVNALWNSDSGSTGNGGGGGSAGAGPIAPISASASISTGKAAFDRDGGKDITVTLTLSGRFLTNVINGSAVLKRGVDYTVSGGTVTISAAYLAGLPGGTCTLTFDMDGGTDPTLTVTVTGDAAGADSMDSTRPDVTLNLPGVTPRRYAFDDVDGDHWAFAYISALAENRVIDGYPTLDGTFTFEPEASISRAETIKLIVASLALPLETDYDGAAFADWASIEEWARPYIGAAVEAGIINGSLENGELLINADNEITRQEMIELTVRALNIDVSAALNIDVSATSDIDVGAGAITAPEGVEDYELADDWARASLAFALDNGMINTDDGAARPLDAATRAEAAMALYGMLAYIHQ